MKIILAGLIVLDICISISNHLKLKKVMGDQSQAVADIQAVTAKLQKIGNESAKTLQKVSDLEAALENQGGTAPEVTAALEELKAQAQIVDDLVPDAVEGGEGTGGEVDGTGTETGTV